MANPEQPGLAFARAWKLIPKSNSSACRPINARIRLPSKQQWNKLILLFFAFQTRLPAKPLRSSPRILDASTAHRVAEGWTYGFPELAPGQAEAIASARRVANPGCYATGAIALLRPLVDKGLLPAEHPVSIHAVSGYSGGGKAMILSYERGEAPSFEAYALGLEHKHVPEIERYARLARRPIFAPSV